MFLVRWAFSSLGSTGGLMMAEDANCASTYKDTDSLKHEDPVLRELENLSVNNNLFCMLQS